MKINEVVTVDSLEEGFWSDLARGAGFKHTAAALDRPEEQLWRQAIDLNSAPAYQDYLNKYPKGNYANSAKKKLYNIGHLPAISVTTDKTEEPTSTAIEVQAGDRLDVVTPKGQKYYKTSTGWFNALNQPITSPNSINYLDSIADAKGVMSKNMAPVAPSMAAVPTIPAKPMAQPQAPAPATTTAPVGIPAKAKMATAKATAAAGPKLGKKGEPLDLSDPKFAKLRAQLAAKGAIPAESKENNKGSNIMNEDTREFSGFNEWRQEVAGMSAGFAKFKRNKEGDLIARYNGKVIGKWYEFEGEGYVYDVDTGTSPIVREDAIKLINKYTVMEMAVRRLKKEKSKVDTPRTGKEWHKTVNEPLPKDKPTLDQVLAPTYSGKNRK